MGQSYERWNWAEKVTRAFKQFASYAQTSEQIISQYKLLYVELCSGFAIPGAASL